MNLAEKLLLVAGIGRSAYGKWRLQRILSIVVTVVILAVTTAAIVSAAAIGASYGLYLYFVSQGMVPALAFLTILCLAALTIFALIAIIRHRVNSLKVSINAPMGDVVDAFFNGLLTE